MRRSCAQWEIWYADIPFEDVTQSKIRPVIVLELKGNYVNVLKLTSKIKHFGYVLQHWQDSKLPRVSEVDCHKKLQIETSRLKSKVGQVQLSDMIQIETILRETFVKTYRV